MRVNAKFWLENPTEIWGVVGGESFARAELLIHILCKAVNKSATMDNDQCSVVARAIIEVANDLKTHIYKDALAIADFINNCCE